MEIDQELRREMIVENYEHPYHKGLKKEAGYLVANTNNESCIDNIDIELKIEDGKIKEANFDGEACAISTSATSLFLQKIEGKNVEEVRKILENYQKMINEEEYDKELLEDLVIYDSVAMQPNRKKCALLPKDTIEKILERL